MCTPVFIAALFNIPRTWKQPRCPSADEWIRKLWYIYTMEYYSPIKKNTFESVLMRWMKLEPMIQSEVSQKEKHQYSILMHIYMEFIYLFIFKFYLFFYFLNFKIFNSYMRMMVMITLYARQQKKHRCIEQSFGLCGRGRGWDDLGEWHWNMYNTICETNHQSRFKAGYRMLGARDMGGGFRMGNTCTPVADSCWCMAKPIQYCEVKK